MGRDLYFRRHDDRSSDPRSARPMNAEFNWWLLIVGVVGGAGLLWLVLGDWSRREEEVGEAERARESAWIAEVMRDEGMAVDPGTARAVLRLHRSWLQETGAYDPLDDDGTVDDAFEPTADWAQDAARAERMTAQTMEAAAAELRLGRTATQPTTGPTEPASARWDAPPMDGDRPER